MARKINVNRRMKPWEAAILPKGNKVKLGLGRQRKQLTKAEKLRKEKRKLEKEQKTNLLNWAKIAGKGKKGEVRPEIFDLLSSRAYWRENPERALKQTASIIPELMEYYRKNPDTVKIMKEMKSINPEVKLPNESEELILLYLRTRGDISNIGKDTIEDIGMMARRFFSRQVSIPEFENRIEKFKANEMLINNVYSRSRYKDEISYEDYRSTFYDYFRAVLKNAKTNFDSGTIKTALLESGIDEIIDEHGITDEILDELIKRIDEKQAEIEEVTSIFQGMTDRDIQPVSSKVYKEKIKRETITRNDTKLLDLDPLQTNKLLPGMSVGDVVEISNMFETYGDVKNAKNIIMLARKTTGENIKYSLETYQEVREILDSMPEGTPNKQIAKRLSDLHFADLVMELGGNYENQLY